MQRQSLICSLLILTLALGCQEAAEYTDSNDGIFNNSADGNNGDASNNGADGDNGTGVAASPLEWCAPAPVPYDVGQIPGLPEGVGMEGFCDAAAPTTPEAPVTRSYVLHRGERLIEVAALSLDQLASNQTFRFDAGGWLREITAEGSTGFYSTGLGYSNYTLNAEGEMVYKLAVEIPFEGAPESEWVGIEKEQTWEGGRLIGRVERSGVDGPVVRTWTWTFEADRLVRAALHDTTVGAAGLRAESRFTYDAAGRPASVERLLNDVLVEREVWTFDADGALRERTFASRSASALAAEHGGSEWEWLLPAGLDTFQRIPNDYMRNPWAEALPVAKGDCFIPPRGPGHGYPDGEAEHQLGVEQEGRPVGIGFAYGSDTYGWYYGDQAWYGHDGIGSGWLGGAGNGEPVAVETTVRYDARGVMTSESARVTPLDDVAVEVERTRTFDGQGAIVRDDLKFLNGDYVRERSLRFDRDANGALTARALHEGDALLARQTWTRDARGRALTHALEAPAASAAMPLHRFEGWEALFAGFNTGANTTAAWTWRYEGDHLVERSGGDNDLHQTLRWDEQGRLIATEGSFTAFDPAVAQEWTFDEAGRVTLQCTSWDASGATCTRSAFDSAGRLVWREVETPGADPQVTDLHTYTCEP